MIEINKINNQYLEYKRLIEEKNNKIELWQKEIDILAEDYQIEEANIIKAKRKNDHQEEKKSIENIETIKDRVQQIQSEAIIISKSIKEVLQQIDKLIEELFNDKTMKDIIIQKLEEQYISIIDELASRKGQLQVQYIKMEKIVKLFQRNPELAKEMENFIESYIELSRVNFVIDNLEHNGMLNKKEPSNQQLLEKSKKEKEEQERKNIDSLNYLKANLSIADYSLIEEKIQEIIQTHYKDNDRVKVDKTVGRQVKDIKNELTRINKYLTANKRELKLLKLLKKKQKRKWWKKDKKGRKRENKEEIVQNEREAFLNTLEYEIVTEGMYQIRNEIKDKAKEIEETR